MTDLSDLASIDRTAIAELERTPQTMRGNAGALATNTTEECPSGSRPCLR